MKTKGLLISRFTQMIKNMTQLKTPIGGERATGGCLSG